MKTVEELLNDVTVLKQDSPGWIEAINGLRTEITELVKDQKRLELAENLLAEIIEAKKIFKKTREFLNKGEIIMDGSDTGTKQEGDAPKCIICNGEFSAQDVIYHGPFHEDCISGNPVELLRILHEKFKREMGVEYVGGEKGVFHYSCPMCRKEFTSRGAAHHFTCDNPECITVMIQKYL